MGYLGIGLSFVFGCILMGLVAELYYLLWWKKRISNSETGEEDSCFAAFNLKKPNNPSSNSQDRDFTNPEAEQVDLEMGSTKEGIEAEIMRIHNLCGPPRFLFTINEESKEDLESDDGKSKRSSRRGSRTKSLSDFLFSSPTVRAPSCLSDSYSKHGFGNNTTFECPIEAEVVNRLRSSPPPKFKFLNDAEDKLIRKMLAEEAERRMSQAFEDSQEEEEK
ncbi:hypothetical protein OROHE_021500 [Orobanche hederae]